MRPEQLADFRVPSDAHMHPDGGRAVFKVVHMDLDDDAYVSRVWLWWSGGKDSAWAHAVLSAQPDARVAGLVTTIGEDGRVAAHGVPRALIDAQARSLGLPVRHVPLPQPCPNADYEAAFAEVVRDARKASIDAMAFGDLFLEDVRDYRAGLLDGTEIAPWFPLWGISTAELARTMIDGGLQANVVSLDPKRVDPRLLGRSYDRALLHDLPPSVDPCGERGEFHTFVGSAPGFAAPVSFRVGETRAHEDGTVRVEIGP